MKNVHRFFINPRKPKKIALSDFIISAFLFGILSMFSSFCSNGFCFFFFVSLSLSNEFVRSRCECSSFLFYLTRSIALLSFWWLHFHGASFKTDSSKIVISLEKLIGVMFVAVFVYCYFLFHNLHYAAVSIR